MSVEGGIRDSFLIMKIFYFLLYAKGMLLQSESQEGDDIQYCVKKEETQQIPDSVWGKYLPQKSENW